MPASSRSASAVLAQIATLLELRGDNSFKVRAYRNAGQAVDDLNAEDLTPLVADGTLKATEGIGPATLAVLLDLTTLGSSTLLEQLQEETPEGLVEMLRVPGLGPAKIRAIHDGLGIDTLQELEETARDGRLAALPRFGDRTAQKILRGIAFLRESVGQALYPRALADGARMLELVRAHPDVERAELAGSLRRRCEVIGDIDIVAACRESPAETAAVIAQAPGVARVTGGGGASITVKLDDGARMDLYCVPPDEFAVALWRATGSAAHVEQLRARLTARGLSLDGDTVRDASGRAVPVTDEAALARLAGIDLPIPELREGLGEVEAAARHALPRPLELADLKGILHCHSKYSDGTDTVAELAEAARARGWQYIGISDHSQSAVYAGGLDREAILRQHDEINEVNASVAVEGSAVRVLKGIEADILADGRVDYDADLLDRFDYVIASVHSRFGMNQAQMTERVIAALDDPHVTILGHPTGRLLLTREPYAIDMPAVIAKAAECGVAVELNADPHRLDLDWRYCRAAKEKGALIEIGPDAHSVHGLDHVEFGIGIARKGWLEAGDVLNTKTAAEVLAFAERRRAAGRLGAGRGQ
jgi:DNA polymerase (family 10)